MKNTCAELGVRAIEYPIGQDFLPLPGLEPGPDEWVYLVNYYGQLGPEQAQALSERYGRRVIWDNVRHSSSRPAPEWIPFYLPEVLAAGRGLSLHRLPPERAAGAG